VSLNFIVKNNDTILKNKNDRLAKLLKLSAENNKHAFKELYEKTSPSVYRLALYLLQKKQRAEAVLEEVYIEIWQSCQCYDNKKSSVSAWILDIARKQISNKLNEIRQCV